jgi:hypothetical protein
VDFSYTILYESQDGTVIERTGVGQFYPSDNHFQLEHMLWLMAEEFGRPEQIEVKMKFWGDRHVKDAPKRIESPKTTPEG